MPLQRTRNFTSALLAVTMLATPAAGAAPAPASASAPAQVDPMVALSVMGTAESRAALCAPGSGVAICPGVSMAAASAGSVVAAGAGAAQDPPIYDETRATRGSMMPLWIALAVVLAGWAWIILDDDDEDDDVDLPESPA